MPLLTRTSERLCFTLAVLAGIVCAVLAYRWFHQPGHRWWAETQWVPDYPFDRQPLGGLDLAWVQRHRTCAWTETPPPGDLSRPATSVVVSDIRYSVDASCLRAATPRTASLPPMAQAYGNLLIDRYLQETPTAQRGADLVPRDLYMGRAAQALTEGGAFLSRWSSAAPPNLPPSLG
jgi:hypothetical protein